MIVDESGDLFGTSVEGGVNGPALGTVFEIAPTGSETVLYSFCSQPDCSDSYEPYSGVVADASGNLYGPTSEGGAGGTVFKVSSNGAETVLYSFCQKTNCSDGASPHAGLVLVGANLYGATARGGAYNQGAVFRLTTGGTEIVLYSFAGGSDGSEPFDRLLMSKWTLYGTTSGGGSYGGGTVFKVTTKGVETILHSFCGQANCADGSYPIGGLIADKSGNLYGTTYYGGANTGCTEGNTYRCGTVFEVTPGGSESVIYSFCAQPGCTDGAYPSGGPVIDASGNLYGTTVYGGTNAYAGGTVYVISPGGSETVLHSFYSAEDGYAYYPPDKLLLSKRYLYGATQCGGNSGGGIVFRLSKDGGWRRFAARAVIFEEEPLAAFVLCRSEPR